jgi:hypothetical protein
MTCRKQGLPKGHKLGPWVEGIKCRSCGVIDKRWGMRDPNHWQRREDRREENVCASCGHIYDHLDSQGEWITVAVRQETTRKGVFVQLHEKERSNGEG